MMKILLSFVLLFYAVSSFAENDRAFFWQVTSPTATVYLLGSIHFADESFYPLRKKIVSAFEQADNLVVELDVNSIDVNQYSRVIQAQGSYPAGDSIASHVSAKTLVQLKQVLADLGVSYDVIKQQKPGVIVLTLTAVQAIKLGLDAGSGIDQYFLSRVKSKKIIELESLQQQLDLFVFAPNQELLLRESLDSFDDADDFVDEMISAWKLGDESAMKKLLFEDAIKESPAFSAIYEALFFKRNRQMSKKIRALLAGKKVSFVVVGAGHLVGDKGIVHLLKAQDFKVERL